MTDTAVANSTLVRRDVAAFHGKGKFTVADLIAHAARKSGRSAASIGWEMMKYAHGPAKIRNNEYVHYGLYDHARFTDAQRREFISAEQHNHIVTPCNNIEWAGVAVDKWVNAVFCGAAGVPMPEIVAVIDAGPRTYHGTEKLTSPDALRGFLTDGAEFPLFCKYNHGRWSVGTCTILSADAQHIQLKGKPDISYEDFFKEYVGKDVFLIQKFIANHADLMEFTPTTATVRMVNMWTKDGLWTPHAILKLPSSQNNADNFWRPGNLVCQLDGDTGEVLTVVGKDGPDLVRHEVHPETGKPILGRRLPHWDAVRALNARVAAQHAPVPYSTQDIAISQDGPVLIEFNWGGAFELPQIATGQGFLTDDVRAFFRSIGSTRV